MRVLSLTIYNIYLDCLLQLMRSREAVVYRAQCAEACQERYRQSSMIHTLRMGIVKKKKLYGRYKVYAPHDIKILTVHLTDAG